MENRMIDPVAVGKKLRLLRGIRTRAEVEKETGISQARLGNYEVTVQNLFFADNNNETL